MRQVRMERDKKIIAGELLHKDVRIRQCIRTLFVCQI